MRVSTQKPRPFTSTPAFYPLPPACRKNVRAYASSLRHTSWPHLQSYYISITKKHCKETDRLRTSKSMKPMLRKVDTTSRVSHSNDCTNSETTCINWAGKLISRYYGEASLFPVKRNLRQCPNCQEVQISRPDLAACIQLRTY